MMRRMSLKSWLARKLDARYVKRSELERIITRLDATMEESQAELRELQRIAREGGFSIESLLATELELQQQIDAITGAGL